MPGKVVLFFPSYYSDEAAPPLALIHLAAPLVERGYDVRIVDSAITPDSVGTVLREAEGALCVGISMVTGPMITQGVEVARAVRARFPEVPLVAGGWHASILPEQTLRAPYFDAVVKGQGEITFQEVVERFDRGERDLTGIAGCHFKRDGRVVWNGDRGYTDINGLPPRPFHLVDFEAYARKCSGLRWILYCTSHGCPWDCSYCSNASVYGRNWKPLAPESAVAEMAVLRRQGIDAEAYSGATDNDDRIRLEQALLANELKVLVATSALGMGFDKPDLGFVIHYQSPGSPIAYYQQVGRAGRALDHAPAVLLCGVEDREIQDYFIETAFPPREQAEAIVSLLASAGESMSLNDLMATVNVRRNRLESMLKVLEVEGAVARERGGYVRTDDAWAYPAERIEHITELRRHEQEAMRRYARHDGCLMEFLRRELDDPHAAACGRCMRCTASPLVVDPSEAMRVAAREHLRGFDLVVEPRKQWPSGLTAFGLPKGRIDEAERPLAGRALSVVGDGGWGRLVASGRGDDERFADELVEASATLIRDRWRPEPAPAWVACVPSMTHPDLVPDFAGRLASALGLELHEVLRKVAENQPQSAMRNSAQQLRNAWDAFEVTGAAPDGPVLLVDDLTDSRWTLTVVARALRLAGSGPVHPFVLATAIAG